ncbi:DNA segregation ATPase FtsK/SpoIIIE-like protein [Streptomyces sp. B3I7]|uniref:FHA domain-containing protein n=1 Tax=Streptomyces sp. B3I7 TaxID=3042269 RepID=UPI00277DAB1A|nr:FHA domain-containing protein [Streptomyces sp. B3I7]MDQ0813111.1 DNA segregation ATPase FtsK/SpoIIIE-like protein [Streptomyces sp. B3I7]
MQIRLTVVDPLGPPAEPGARAASRDVLVTAPAGTALAAVAADLVSAVGGGDGPAVLYAGAERLDPQRRTLGEPPLTDGAVLSLGAPVEPGPGAADDVSAELHVVAGPDAGGVHLLHGGQIRVGRSADADVPLDDPDVSRLHCAVTVAPDGRVTVADLGSTNGTALDGVRVTDRPVRLVPGALLRLGESTLRLAPPGGVPAVPTTPDGEGHTRIRVTGAPSGAGAGALAGAPGDAGAAAPRPAGASAGRPEHGPTADGQAAPGAYGTGTPGPHGHPAGEPAGASGTSGASGHTDAYGGGAGAVTRGGEERLGRGGTAAGRARDLDPDHHYDRDRDRDGDRANGFGGPDGHDGPYGFGQGAGVGGRSGDARGRTGTPVRGTDVPDASNPTDVRVSGDPGAGTRRRGGLAAWARRLAGGRDEATAGGGPTGHAEGVAPTLPHRPQGPEKWPDPAVLLLTALRPGPRLWERGPLHPEALTVRLGTADLPAVPDGTGPLLAVPVTTGLREVGSLGLAGPRARLGGLARAVLAQLVALHSPDTLEIVLISADRARPVEERTAEWSWLGWLPHLVPAHGQDCRLLLAHDRDQATARTTELLRRLDDRLAEFSSGAAPRVPHQGGPGDEDETARRPSWARDAAAPAEPYAGPRTVLVVDGDPGGADVREGVVRLVREGPRAGIHVICLAETAAASPTTPAARTYQAVCAESPTFRECGAVALLSGDVATAVRILRVAPHAEPGAGDSAAPHPGDGPGAPTARARAPRPGHAAEGRVADPSVVPRPRGAHEPHGAHGTHDAHTAHTAHGVHGGHSSASASDPSYDPQATHHDRTGRDPRDAASGGRIRRSPVSEGTVAAVDAVSLAWAERFARALAPLRTDGPAAGTLPHPRISAPLPRTARLLDELGLARATPPSLMARWAAAADDTESLGGRAWAVLGAGPRGPVVVDLAADGPHLLVEGPSGSGRTELLRAVAASLAAAERPDRLGLVLIDGRDCGPHASGADGGLRLCTDLPHVTTHLAANDPVRMRQFAQSLSAELKRRAELLGRLDFAEWHTQQAVSRRLVPQRAASGPGRRPMATDGTSGATSGGAPGGGPSEPAASGAGAADLESPPSATLRLRPPAARRAAEPGPALARLVVVVDDLDALLSPALGSPGRPSAGSVVRALEAVARDGERLGVHLVAATEVDGARTFRTEPGRAAGLRVRLRTPAQGADEPAPGRGRLTYAHGTQGTPGTEDRDLNPDRDRDMRATEFQGGRVTGRIPRTATVRPTVAPVEWERMGDPPVRRTVRELGNGPTDLALLASALERAARSVSATGVPPLL